MDVRKTNNRVCRASAAILFMFVLMCAGAWGAQMTYDLTDAAGSIDWRGSLTNVGSVTETYSYNEGTDTLTVTATFNASDSLAPLAPMLALAKDYGFPITFDQTVVSTACYSTLGPLKGVQNTNTYTYHIAGLGNYVLAPQSLGSGTVPSWIQDQLEQQIDNVLAVGGHLRPWLVLTETPGGSDYRGEVYWHYPGDALYFLSEAAPLLSGTRLDDLKSYLQTERGAYPPETQASISFTTGTSREYCGPTDTLMTYWQNRLSWRTTGTPGIWNLYGLARYYELMQQTPTSQVMTNCTNLINTRMQYRHWPTLYWLSGHAPHYNAVHGVNQIFAGLVGYIRLARMAGDTEAENLGWGLLGRMATLRYAMGKYTQYEYDKGYFQIPQPLDPEWFLKQEAYGWVGGLVTWDWTQPIDNVRQLHWLTDANVMTWEWCSVGFDQGDNGQKTMPPPPGYAEFRPHWGQGTAYLLPFCDMVPELGKFMKDYLVPEVNEFCARVVENQPNWYMAYAPAILGQEIGFNVPGDSYGQFIARAWVLDEDADTLAGYLDTPWLPKGDLFYIHKLAETIKTYRNAGAPDITPPTPDPLTWATAPHATGDSSISMTAATASDPSGVEYFFDCTAGAGHDSVWQTSSAYTDTGLSPDTQYTYRVKARDKSANHNETGWSSALAATTDPADTTAPTPNPLTWAVVPYSTGTSSVSMTATTASDPAGVEYYFECTAGGGHSSGWQTTPTYNDTGLDPNTQYTYRTRARDLSSNHNQTAWSTSQSATTDPSGGPIEGLLAWWKFDETSGTSAADSSGNGNTGTLYGSPTWVAGHFNNAISLDGVDDYVSGFSVDMGGVWSITVWAKPLASPEFQGLLGATAGGGYYVQLQSNRLHYKAASNHYTSFTQDLDWHHFAITRSASGDLNVYIDGVPVDSYNDAGTPFVVSEIGRFWGNSEYTYEGHVDDLRLYNRVLNQAEVEAVMAGGGGGGGDTTPPTPDPLTWATVPYAIGSTSISMVATTASDSSGVEYFFDCTAGGGNDSGWQDNTSYTDTGLTPSTQYTYRVQARDKSASQNETAWSTSESATTGGGGGVTEGLVAWWRFDDGSGTSAADSSGNDNTGVLNGDVVWGSGPSGFGGAVDFDSDDSMTVASLYSMDLGDTFSVTFWMYPTNSDGWKRLIHHGDNDRVSYGYGNTVVGYGGTEVAGPQTAVNTWVHIAITHAADGTTLIYKNGANPVTRTTGSYTGAGNTFTVGGFTYAGLMDDLRIYDRVLSAEEVAQVTDPNYLPGSDTTAPTPDPMTWAVVPYSTGTSSISMTATTASDPSGAEYYFECTAGGGNDSGWQDSATYEDTGLNPATQYTYRVQARDKSANQNTGGWSTSESATTDTPADTTPPTPDPLTWASVPASTGTTSISMTGTTASDPSGVEYFFDCTAGAGHDSGWQDGTAYEDTGLDPNTQYTYRAQARDKSANQNAGGWSTSESATTDAGGAVTLLQDGFETDFDNWTDGGATDWDRTTSQKYSGSYSAHAGSSDNDLISDNLNTAGRSSMTISFWYRDDDIDDGDDVYLQLYNGSSYVNRYELGITSPEDTWHYYEETINNSGGDAAYFISNFRMKFEGTSIDNGENLWIDDVLVTVEGTGGDPNLLAWWQFDETSGNTAADSSGNGNTGTTYGSPTWTTGHISGGLSLDGADDYVSGFSVDLGGVWSIAIWAQPLASPEFQGLLGTVGSGGYYVQLQSYRLHYKAQNNHYTSFTQDLGWHHFAITRAATGDMNIYIDGAPVDSYNDTATPFVISEIGRFWGDSVYTYQGVVDDLRLYNRVLTATEVQNLAAQ